MTSFTELGREAHAITRENALHSGHKKTFIETQLCDTESPVIAATDYIKMHAEQIRPYLQAPYVTLGTDGYGRSDTRAALRAFFEVNAKWIAFVAIETLSKLKKVPSQCVKEAIKRYDIDVSKPNPMTQ